MNLVDYCLIMGELLEVSPLEILIETLSEEDEPPRG